MRKKILVVLIKTPKQHHLWQDCTKSSTSLPSFSLQSKLLVKCRDLLHLLEVLSVFTECSTDSSYAEIFMLLATGLTSIFNSNWFLFERIFNCVFEVCLLKFGFRASPIVFLVSRSRRMLPVLTATVSLLQMFLIDLATIKLSKLCALLKDH